MLASLALCATAGALPSTALAWAAGTHAYIATHTHKMNGRLDEGAICRRALGANLPDLFNEIYSAPTQALAAVTHTDDATANLAPYFAALNADERALAFGYGSHNNQWGTDSTAHVDAVTQGLTLGYVPAKAQVVGALMAPSVAAALDLPLDAAQALATEAGHNFVEFAVDFLLAMVDPTLGPSLAEVAACYQQEADNAFLLRAMGPWFAPVLSDDPDTGLALAAYWIEAVTPPFVAQLGVNGEVLSLPYAQALPAFAELYAPFAVAYLQAKGLDVDPALVQQLLMAGIHTAVQVCAADFKEEIDATIGRVNAQMSQRKLVP